MTIALPDPAALVLSIATIVTDWWRCTPNRWVA